MAGELSGALRSYDWVGGFWLWNAAFLTSTSLLLLMGLGTHLPANWASRPWLRLLAGAALGVALNLVILTHQLGGRRIKSFRRLAGCSCWPWTCGASATGEHQARSS